MAGQGSAILLGLAVLAAPEGLLARDQNSASASGQAAASVVRSLSLLPLADLHFGAVAVSGQGDGQVTVGAADVSFAGSARPACGQRADCAAHPALFSVSGEASRTYRITISAQVEARGQNTGAALEVGNLTVDSANLANADGLGKLGLDGLDRFTVGGTLFVPGGTRPDTFRADLPVTIAYE